MAKNAKLINWLAGATIAAAVVWLYVFFNPSPPAIDRSLHKTVGEVMAAEAIKLLEDGGRLVVIARAKEPFQVPAADAQLDAFMRALKKSGKTVTTERMLKIDPLRVVTLPTGDFFELARKAETNDVIVSFMGPPGLSNELLQRLGNKRPRVLALCSGAMPVQVDLRKIFEAQLLRTAVVSRTNAPARPDAADKRAAFDQMFAIITSANLAELPSPAAARH